MHNRTKPVKPFRQNNGLKPGEFRAAGTVAIPKKFREAKNTPIELTN